jgi:hypothetical protein
MIHQKTEQLISLQIMFMPWVVAAASLLSIQSYKDEEQSLLATTELIRTLHLD